MIHSRVRVVSGLLFGGPLFFSIATFLSLQVSAYQIGDSDDYWNTHGDGKSIEIEAGTGRKYGDLGVPAWVNQPDATGAGFTGSAGGAPQPPPSVPTGCLGQLVSGQWVEDACPLIGPARGGAADPASEDFVPPATIDILYQGLASTQVSPAGLVVQPDQWAYTGIPTLVHAASGTQTKSVSVLGYDVEIALTAATYSFDFGDGSRPLVTRDPGAPYPDTTNQHTYTTPVESRQIALVTTWNATTTNPFTGETLTVPGIIQTREISPPFEVRTARTVLTDTAEERAGH